MGVFLMAKINIVLTDTDELYLNRLADYLIEKAESFNVSSFNSPTILNDFLANKNNKVDILIIPLDFVNDSIKKLDITAKIILSEGEYDKLEGFEYVNKYQKADKFISDILLIFAEKTGRTDAVSRGNKKTKMIALYSPVGGSGKTTLALALATLCAGSGFIVFYLNFEKLDSSRAFFTEAPHGNMSDIFLALKTPGSNLGLKIMSNRYSDPVNKINYFNSPDSAMEYNELSEAEVTRLITEFEVLGEYDLVFVDMNSAFDNYNLNILAGCDHILLPFCTDSLSLAKMAIFLNEFRLHERMGSLTPKIHLIANKTDANAGTALQSSSVLDFKEVEGNIPYSHVLADIKNISYVGNLNQTALASIVNIIVQS